MPSKKEGFVKTPRAIEQKLYGPESPLPEKWRVFNLIKYRIQDNKRKSQSERMSREYILAKTGVWPNNFSRIIKSLIADQLIEMTENKDGVATYFLSRLFFGNEVIVPDQKTSKNPNWNRSKKNVDKSCGQDVDNINLMSKETVQHQNDVSQHQNDEDMGIPRPLSPIPLLNLKARDTDVRDFKFKEQQPWERYGLNREDFKNCVNRWQKETQGSVQFMDWLDLNNRKMAL